MIQPAALPFAGNLLMALGLPGGGAGEPGNSADFSYLLAANIEGEPAGKPFALAVLRDIEPATGKPTGKVGGKALPDGLDGRVRLLAKGETSLLPEPEVATKLETALSDEPLAAEPSSHTLDGTTAVTFQVPATDGPPSLAQLARTPQTQAAPVEVEADASTPASPERASGGQSPQPPLAQRNLLNPSPLRGRLGGGAPRPDLTRGALARGFSAALTHPRPLPAEVGGRQSVKPNSAGFRAAAVPGQIIAIGAAPPPSVAAQTVFLPFAIVPQAGTPLAFAPGAPVPLPEMAPPAATLTQLLRTAQLAPTPTAFDPPALAPFEIASGEHLPIAALQPVSAAPGLPSAGFAIAAAMPRAVDQALEQAEPRAADAAAIPGSPVADSAPAPLPSAATNPLSPQTSPVSAPPVTSQTPAAAQPHDFAALIDRLVEARDMAQANFTPATVSAALAHAEFGAVTLQFAQDTTGLTVALANDDPEFARAVQAAAPASGASDQHTQARQEAPGQQNAGSAQAQSNPQQRGQSAPRDTHDHRAANNPGRGQRQSDEPPTRGGIFA